MNIVYALLKNDKYSIKIVSRMHISFLLSVESAQEQNKTGVEFADTCTDKRKPEFFSQSFPYPN